MCKLSNPKAEAGALRPGTVIVMRYDLSGVQPCGHLNFKSHFWLHIWMLLYTPTTRFGVVGTYLSRERFKWGFLNNRLVDVFISAWGSSHTREDTDTKIPRNYEIYLSVILDEKKTISSFTCDRNLSHGISFGRFFLNNFETITFSSSFCRFIV